MKQSPDDLQANRESTRPEPSLQANERPEVGEQTPSTAPDTSWDTGAGGSTTGFDSPPADNTLPPNVEVDETQHRRHYYPPGAAPSSEPEPDDETT